MWQTTEYHYHFNFSFGTGHHSYLLPLMGLGLGVGVFANGFRTYRELRIVEDMPRIAVRAVPMGLVHVHGKATGHNPLTSPVTSTPCYYYMVHLERWEGQNKGWRPVHTATEGRTFYVDDGTGRVLINHQGAEFDLPSVYRAEFGPHAKAGPYLDPSLGLAAGPSEQDLRAYAAKAHPTFTIADRILGQSSYRVTEHCLVAEHEYDVIGTCAPNPQPQGDDDRNLILKGQNEPTFVISGFSELKLEKALRKRALIQIAVGGVLIVTMMGFIIAQSLSP